jgi:two-component system sensor histidine kinase TtrS
LYPCDPDTPTWKVPVEVTRPEYPGAFVQGVEIATDSDVAGIFQEAISTTDPATRSFDHDGTEPDWVRHFNIQSQMTIAVRPKIDKPWLLGMHQCSHKRQWSEEDKRLFRDIAERVTNALTNRSLLERLESDIEERKRTEKELERQKTLFETVFNDVPDAMILANSQRAIVMCNPAFSRTFGYEPTDLVGKKTEILYENLEEYEHQGRIRFSPGAEEQLKPYVLNYKRKNGEVFPGETVGTSIKTKNGDTLGFIGVIRDITERKLAEEQARQHQAELAHMARLNTMGELATGIAHELNQPLAAIANYAAACRKMLDSSDNHSEKLAKALEATQIQSKRASDIIRHLRQFVRKQSPQKSPINLNDLINAILGFMESEIDKQGIKIRLELTQGLPEVIADAIQIEQVLVNLLQNSMETMSHVDMNNRQLVISTHLTKKHEAVQVEVADTGMGIDTETLKTIFEPFVTTKGNKGMGLGLSISRSIIEAHNGRLWVTSQLGSGSRFYFTLPTMVER